MSSARRRSRIGDSRIVVAFVALVALAGVIIVAVVVTGSDDAEQPPTAERGSGDPLDGGDEAVDGSVDFERSGEVVGGPAVTVLVTPPGNATEMQIGTDPTFSATPWTPLRPEVEVEVFDTGFQTVFGRFREGPDATPTAVSVDGITVDPTYAAATSAERGPQEASWVRPIGPDALIVRVEGGRLAHGAPEPYDFESPPPGDVIGEEDGLRTVERDGDPYGIEVEGDDRMIKRHDRLVGATVDEDLLTRSDWTITTGEETFEPSAVTRRTSAAGVGRGPGGDLILPAVHDVVLQLPVRLEPGRDYTLAAPDGVIAPAELRIDPQTTRSPVVHVNQVGYRPDDPAKTAFLSAHLTGVSSDAYRPGMGFQVVDVESGSTVLRGQTSERPVPDDGELGRGDLTGAPVFAMDFTSLDQVGRFRVCVDDVGCSASFAVADDAWAGLAATVSRAMYHQRSGVGLGAPHTAIDRPRPYHPDDGLVVNQSGFTVLEATLGSADETFRGLLDQRTEDAVDGAWGGHFDAGDWDRNIQHLWYVRSVAELVEAFPETYENLDLNIPESGDAVPDILDEGLWTLDLFVRLQRDDGAVRGGIEASDHPSLESTSMSWTDDLAVYAFAPDPWASYIHAGVAAEVARVLEPYDSARAAVYETSAVAAFEWAEDQPTDGGLGDDDAAERIATQRGVAAASLLARTGDDRYDDVFAESTPFDDEVVSSLSCHDRGLCDAAWIYLAADESVTDPEVRANVRRSVIDSAERTAAAADTTAFGWALENPDVPLVWGLGPGGSPEVTGLLRAHLLTGDDRYREIAVRSTSVSLGANPLNQVFLTGIGDAPVRHPLIVDIQHGGLPVWPGTPVYGFHDLNATGDDSWVQQFFLDPSGATPSTEDAPFLWQYQDLSNVAMFNEFTVAQSHAAAVYAFGVLGGLPAD